MLFQLNKLEILKFEYRSYLPSRALSDFVTLKLFAVSLYHGKIHVDWPFTTPSYVNCMLGGLVFLIYTVSHKMVYPFYVGNLTNVDQKYIIFDRMVA